MCLDLNLYYALSTCLHHSDDRTSLLVLENCFKIDQSFIYYDKKIVSLKYKKYLNNSTDID